MTKPLNTDSLASLAAPWNHPISSAKKKMENGAKRHGSRQTCRFPRESAARRLPAVYFRQRSNETAPERSYKVVAVAFLCRRRGSSRSPRPARFLSVSHRERRLTILVPETRSRTPRDSRQIYLRARGDAAFESFAAFHVSFAPPQPAALKAGRTVSQRSILQNRYLLDFIININIKKYI